MAANEPGGFTEVIPPVIINCELASAAVKWDSRGGWASLQTRVYDAVFPPAKGSTARRLRQAALPARRWSGQPRGGSRTFRLRFGAWC